MKNRARLNKNLIKRVAHPIGFGGTSDSPTDAFLHISQGVLKAARRDFPPGLSIQTQTVEFRSVRRGKAQLIQSVCDLG